MDGADFKQIDTAERIVSAIKFIDRASHSQLPFTAIAAIASRSEYRFSHQFRPYTDITLKQCLENLTPQSAKTLPERTVNVETTSYNSDLSDSARLQDNFVTLEAVARDEYKDKGRELIVRYGQHPGPIGNMFLAQTERGICTLAFVDKNDFDEPVKIVLDQWPCATLIPDQGATAVTAAQVFSKFPKTGGLRLFVRGTSFQLLVWRALLTIRFGKHCSYGELANTIGHPGAGRAVGNAVGANPVSYLIPCHRVLRADGAIGNYRWGSERKAAILQWEEERVKSAAPS